MSEEQMNELISVLKNIRDELQISNVSQPNRKYMREYLEITNIRQQYMDNIVEYEDKIERLNRSENIKNKESLLNRYTKWLDHWDNMDKLYRNKQEQLESMLADDIRLD